MKKLLSIILALALVMGLSVPVLAAESDFTIENGVLTKYNGEGGDVVIPDGVTSIGKRAFSDCTGLTSVIIPEGVTTIGVYAFEGCTGLTSVTIPSSVTSISLYAFANCTGLTSVNIPSSVTSIGSWAFQGCVSLTSVTIPASVTSIGVNVFESCFSLVSATFSEGATTIGEGMFVWCESLSSVTIPSSVTTIGTYAFIGCDSLTSVTIPSSVTSIGYGAFANTPWLESQGEFAVANGILLAYQGTDSDVVIPEGITTIGAGAFDYCYNLTDVYYAGSAEQWEAVKVEYTYPVFEAGAGLIYLDCNQVLLSATIHYADATPATIAYARTQTIAIDGKAVELQAYALKDENGYETNYVKLRDVAYALNGTSAQFNVGWDGNVNIVTGAAYNPNGSEMSTPFSGDRAYTVPTTGTNVNGVAADLAAIVLTDDSGGGHTYYQLRDLGKALGFHVDWTAERGIFIETETEDNSASGTTSETNQGPILVKSDDEYGLSYWVEYGPLGPVYTPACESDLCRYSNYNCYGEDDPDHVEYADERMVIDAYLHGAIQECTVEAWEEYVARRDGNTQN